MVIELDREKKIVLLRWLQQGYIDTHDIEEMGRPQRGIPIERWLEWEGNGTADVIQQIETEAGVIP